MREDPTQWTSIGLCEIFYSHNIDHLPYKTVAYYQPTRTLS